MFDLTLTSGENTSDGRDPGTSYLCQIFELARYDLRTLNEPNDAVPLRADGASRRSSPELIHPKGNTSAG
jgi:hypothetical protein